jgi:aspartate kinase
VLDDLNINVKMISQGASKTNISLIVPSGDAEIAVQELHAEFFGVTNACAASEAALSKVAPTSVK